MQEGGHLTAGDVAFGAELGVLRGVTPRRYPGSAETVDVTFEDRIVVVSEQVSAAVIGIAEGTDQEGSHLLPRYIVTRTEPIVVRRITSLGDSGRTKAVD